MLPEPPQILSEVADFEEVLDYGRGAVAIGILWRRGNATNCGKFRFQGPIKMMSERSGERAKEFWEDLNQDAEDRPGA